MNAFINCERIDDLFVERLINNLKLEGFMVSTSPKNPIDGEDIRWNNWYNFGIDEALQNIDVFISIITDSWSSSTWMAIECDTAEKYFLQNSIKNMYYIDLRTSKYMPKGMEQYLKTELPKNFNEILKIIKA